MNTILNDYRKPREFLAKGEGVRVDCEVFCASNPHIDFVWTVFQNVGLRLERLKLVRVHGTRSFC